MYILHFFRRRITRSELRQLQEQQRAAVSRARASRYKRNRQN